MVSLDGWSNKEDPILHFLQQSLTIASRVTLQEIHRTIMTAHEPVLQQVVGSLGRALDEIILLVSTDGAHAVMPKSLAFTRFSCFLG